MLYCFLCKYPINSFLEIKWIITVYHNTNNDTNMEKRKILLSQGIEQLSFLHAKYVQLVTKVFVILP